MKGKRIHILTLVLMFFLMSGCGSAQEYLSEQMDKSGGAVGLSSNETEMAAAEADMSCCVHVSGAVMQPGVYTLAGGSRLCDAVEAAGGFSGEADRDYLNLAAYLEDGQQYHVPTKGEAGGSEGEQAVYTPDGKLDLNRAGVSDLQTLSGIGASKAEAILAYREEHGRFSSVEELKQVSGIGDGLFEKLKDHVIVR